MTAYPRQQIAEAVSDLREMRRVLGDLQIEAHNLLRGFPDAPADVRRDLTTALEAIDHAHEISQARIRELYATKTPEGEQERKGEAA